MQKEAYPSIRADHCILKHGMFHFQSASGTGLAFILFTEAVNQFPGGNFWAILFFMMLFTLGLDSQFGTLQGVIQCFIDLKLFPNLRKEILTGIKGNNTKWIHLLQGGPSAHGLYIFSYSYESVLWPRPVAELLT